jgi:hypothetical protein
MRPDFSGTWEADLARSRLLRAAPERMSVHIDHRDPKLIQTIVITTNGEEQRLEFRFTTDGAESVNSLGGTTRAHWCGDELEIESAITLGGRDLNFRDYWSLSPNGQILTMEHRDDELAGQIAVLLRMPSE